MSDEAEAAAQPSPGSPPEPAYLRAWSRVRRTASSHALSASLLIVVAIGIVSYLQQWIGGLFLLAALLGWGAWRIAEVLFRPLALSDRVLLTITFAAAWIVLVAEGLSAARLLGQPVGWLIGGAALAIGGVWVPARPARWSDRVWSWIPSHPVGRLILAVVALHLCTVFMLTWYTGINIADSVSVYLPRSVRYLQSGTFAVYDTHYDFMPAFHQTMVAIQILFLRSDILVIPSSFLTALVVSIGTFSFARSLGWRSPFPLAAALLPWTMPAFLLHASAPNFDVLTGLWLLLGFYFLRRGYASSSPRWLAAAAMATGLALATKPTFWFAVPALALCWLFTLWRAFRRRGVGRTLRLVVAAAALIAVIGLPFMVRNVLILGALLGPPEMRADLTGELTPSERLYLLSFNSLALGYQLVTPPSLLPRSFARESNDRFLSLAQVLGFQLPDTRLASKESELFRHALPGHRYDSNHASFGAAFVLVVLPSMLALPWLRRRLGPRWLFAAGLVLFGVGYFLTYGLLYRYHPASIRFLVEPMIGLSVIAPAWIAMVPRVALGPLVAGLALLLVPEMSDVIQNNRWMPPSRVMQTDRRDQLYLFTGMAPADAARMLERKYPPSELPELLVHYILDYTFQGPTLQRRTQYWFPEPGSLPPKPLLTFDVTLAKELVAAGMLPDRLSDTAWLLLPNDRLRVRMTVVQENPAADRILRLEASTPPGRYRRPRFGFFLVNGNQRVDLQDFGREPTLRIPLSKIDRGALRIEVRDGEQGRTAERVTILESTIGGL